MIWFYVTPLINFYYPKIILMISTCTCTVKYLSPICNCIIRSSYCIVLLSFTYSKVQVCSCCEFLVMIRVGTINFTHNKSITRIQTTNALLLLFECNCSAIYILASGFKVPVVILPLPNLIIQRFDINESCTHMHMK